jgi:thiol-disulfide isomerase/thioredoxin
LTDKAVCGEDILIYYCEREGEFVDYLEVEFLDYYENGDQRYYKPQRINESVISFTVNIPKNTALLWIAAISNMNCYTGGSSVKMYPVYDKKGFPNPGAKRQIIAGLYDENDSVSADSLIKHSLSTHPDRLMVLDAKWSWLAFQDKQDILQGEMEDLISKKTIDYPEKYILLSKGYYYLDEIDSAAAYLEKYIFNTKVPKFSPKVFGMISYKYAFNNTLFDKEELIQETIAAKCPLSEFADIYLNNIINNHQRDSLAEKIISAQTKESKEGYFYKSLYQLKIRHDTNAAKQAALNYLSQAKDSYIPENMTATGVVKYVMRIPLLYEVLADGTKNIADSYSFLETAIKNCRHPQTLSQLESKAAIIADKLGNTASTKDHLVKLCLKGYVLKAKETIESLNENFNTDSFLVVCFNESAQLCDTVPYLTFTYDSINKITLSDNKIIYLNLWSPYCVPCVHEIPILNNLRNKFDSDIVWLAADFKKEYMDRLPEKFSGWILYQSNEEINEVFLKESMIPQTYIIDKDKRIRYHRIGAFDELSIKETEMILILLSSDE